MVSPTVRPPDRVFPTRCRLRLVSRGTLNIVDSAPNRQADFCFKFDAKYLIRESPFGVNRHGKHVENSGELYLSENLLSTIYPPRSEIYMDQSVALDRLHFDALSGPRRRPQHQQGRTDTDGEKRRQGKVSVLKSKLVSLQGKRVSQVHHGGARLIDKR